MTDSEKLNNCLEAIRLKMAAHGLPEKSITRFQRIFERFFRGERATITRDEISPAKNLPDSETIEVYELAGREALKESVLIKLNGGLGTSMGLDKAKSILEVHGNLTFLDIIARQAIQLRISSKCRVPLVFMNSDNTHEDTVRLLSRYPGLSNGMPGFFKQLMVPKIRPTDFMPVTYLADPDLEWCPPGHGDIYFALHISGILDELTDNGYRYALISNSDNLGAVMDFNILGYFASNRLSFLMEVADRTESDRKGGHLCLRTGGGLMLREIAQCPQEELDEFQDIAMYSYFNTNTIWLDLVSIRDIVERQSGIIDLPIIVNSKPVDPKDNRSERIIQLETAMGAAISVFPGSAAIRVPRSRFLPVKTCQDLIGLGSDQYRLTPEYNLVQVEPSYPAARISLDSRYFHMIQDVRSRFPCGPPSLKECTEWIVIGDFKFGRDITIRGKVSLINETSKQVYIPDGSVFDSTDYRF